MPAQSWLYTCAVPVSGQRTRSNAKLPAFGGDLVLVKTVFILNLVHNTVYCLFGDKWQVVLGDPLSSNFKNSELNFLQNDKKFVMIWKDANV